MENVSGVMATTSRAGTRIARQTVTLGGIDPTRISTTINPPRTWAAPIAWLRRPRSKVHVNGFAVRLTVRTASPSSRALQSAGKAAAFLRFRPSVDRNPRGTIRPNQHESNHPARPANGCGRCENPERKCSDRRRFSGQLPPFRLRRLYPASPPLNLRPWPVRCHSAGSSGRLIGPLGPRPRPSRPPRPALLRSQLKLIKRLHLAPTKQTAASGLRSAAEVAAMVGVLASARRSSHQPRRRASKAAGPVAEARRCRCKLYANARTRGR